MERYRKEGSTVVAAHLIARNLYRLVQVKGLFGSQESDFGMMHGANT